MFKMSKVKLLKAFGFGVSACALIFATPSFASSEDCSTKWNLERPDNERCNNLVILSPGNDTRINLVLLLGDLHASEIPPPIQLKLPGELGAAPFEWYSYTYIPTPKTENGEDDAHESVSIFGYGDGSRCVSSDQGQADFELALIANKSIPDEERETLKKYRAQLNPTCDETSKIFPSLNDLPLQIKSKSGQEFSYYLLSAAAFYDGNFDFAQSGFSTLLKSKDKWLAEASLYMQSRVALNRAQINAFDDWGNLEKEKLDTASLDTTEKYLNQYITTYPNGQYVSSARGLLRRVYWLKGNREKLLAAYTWQIRSAKPNERNLNDLDLATEIDSKILRDTDGVKVTDPIILATIDLYRMRNANDKNNTNLLSIKELETQRDIFNKDKDLFDFLLANHAYYVQNNPALVTKLIPDETNVKNFNSLTFSRQILRGQALEKLNDVNARGFWISMFKPANAPAQRDELEIALALHDENHNNIDKIFASDSLIKDTYIRETLLTNIADAKLLRQVTNNQSLKKHERDVALFTLLYKDLTTGKYSDFLDDYKMVPQDAKVAEASYWYLGDEVSLGVFNWKGVDAEYSCPSLNIIATNLNKNPNSTRYNICLGEFLRINGFDDYGSYGAEKGEIGGSPSQFKGKPFSRLEAYKTTIADPKADVNDKAYSLYRAINCYAPTGSNTCGGIEVPKSQRKAWFNILKTQYKNTPWAKDLRYYW